MPPALLAVPSALKEVLNWKEIDLEIRDLRQHVGPMDGFDDHSAACEQVSFNNQSELVANEKKKEEILSHLRSMVSLAK